MGSYNIRIIRVMCWLLEVEYVTVVLVVFVISVALTAVAACAAWCRVSRQVVTLLTVWQ